MPDLSQQPVDPSLPGTAAGIVLAEADRALDRAIDAESYAHDGLNAARELWQRVVELVTENAELRGKLVGAERIIAAMEAAHWPEFWEQTRDERDGYAARVAELEARLSGLAHQDEKPAPTYEWAVGVVDAYGTAIVVNKPSTEATVRRVVDEGNASGRWKSRRVAMRRPVGPWERVDGEGGAT